MKDPAKSGEQILTIQELEIQPNKQNLALIICQKKHFGKNIIQHLLITHQLIKVFRSNPGKDLKCPNKNCKLSNAIYKPGMIYQYATHILIKCKNANPIKFLRQIAIQQVKWPNLKKVYKK